MISEFVPRIWADVLLAQMERRRILVSQLWAQEQAHHEERMATDPDYAKRYELRQAEDEAMSYWDTLYDNQRPEEEEDEW